MIKLGKMELDKKQSIALIAGIILIIGAGGGYWFYGKDMLTGDETVQNEEETLGDLEGEEGTEEADLFNEEDIFDEGTDAGEGKGDLAKGEDEDLFGLFDEGGNGEEKPEDFFETEQEMVDTVETTGTEEQAVMDDGQKDLAALETAKEKGNVIDLEAMPKATEQEKTDAVEETLKDMLKRESDVVMTEVPAGESKVEKAEKVVEEKKKPVPKTTYRVRSGDTFDDVAKKLGYPVSFQAQLAFLDMNPSHFQGITETEDGKFVFPLKAGEILKLPKKPFKRSWLYNRAGHNIETYVIEFYGTENEASAEVVCHTLLKNGMTAYIRTLGRTYQVMIGFFDSKAAAEKVIKEASLYFGQNDDSINLLKLTRGNDSYDDYVAREREQYYIQIFSSKSRKASLAVLEKARKIQVKTSILTEGRVRGENYYKVRVGSFNSHLEAVVEAKFLKQKLSEVTDFFIRKGKMQEQ